MNLLLSSNFANPSGADNFFRMNRTTPQPWSFRRVRGALYSRVRSRLSLTRLGYVGLATIESLHSSVDDASQFTSQLGQDLLVALLLNARKKPGTFVDIGAHDGISLSNTFFLEKHCGWTGLCVEANPKAYKTLVSTRSCKTENCAIGAAEGKEEFWQIDGYSEMLSGLRSSYDSRHRRRIMNEIRQQGGQIDKVQLEVRPLQDLLDRHEIRDIDFLTIDTEGSELDILRSVDFGKTRIRMMTVENPYQRTSIHRFLHSKGFLRLLRLGSDDVYIHREYFFESA